MAMSALEIIDSYGEQAEESKYAIIAAMKKQNIDLAVLNVNEQFKCTLMQGLIQWRCNFQSPRPALLRAAENFVTGVEIIRSMRGSGGAILGLWFETAAIIGYLVDVTIDSPKLEQPLSNRNLDGLIVK